MGEFLRIMSHASMNTAGNRVKTTSNEFLTISQGQLPAIFYDHYSELVFRINNRIATEQERDQVSNFEAGQPEQCPHCGGQVRREFPPFRIVHDIANCQRRPR